MSTGKKKKVSERLKLTDTEKSTLIEEVRIRPALWDATHDDHKSRAVTGALYDQISAFMRTPSCQITSSFKFIVSN